MGNDIASALADGPRGSGDGKGDGVAPPGGTTPLLPRPAPRAFAAGAARRATQSVRYSDHPMPLGTRLLGASGTGLVCLAIVGAALFKWAVPSPPATPTTLSVFEVAPPEAPPAPDTEIPPGPEQVQKDKPPPEIAQMEAPAPLVPTPSASARNVPAAQPAADPGPPIDRTTAPESRPQPPGSRSSDAKPTWEGQVLAALNAAKRYPREAKRNRQQGMPWVRFAMDRDGRVRSARVVRSSGFDALDREAEALPLRASPLPKPPETVKGDRIELTVPIEFFLAGGG